MQAKVSVIVAIYNIESYLTACVDSLLKSDMPDCEILLIDDGSADGSAIICDACADNNACVTAYHKPNGGLSEARNYGVKRAKGEWIIFVDGDDSVNIERFNEFLRVLRETDSSADVIFNDYILNNLRTGKQSESQQITNASVKTDVLSAKGAIWNVWRYAYRRTFLAKYNLSFKPKWLAEDLDFTTRVFMLPDVKIKFVHIPYYIYAYHRDGSITETASLRFMECMTTSIREYCEILSGRKDRAAKLLKRKLLLDYVKHAAKYFQFKGDECKQVRYYYRAKGSPIPFNAILLAGALRFMGRLYHIGR